MDQLSIPDGYVSFPDIMGSLFWNSQDWNLQSNLLLIQMHKYKHNRDNIVEFLQMERKWKADIAALSFIQATLGKALTSERTQAVGINMYNGELTFLKGAVWRVPVIQGSESSKPLPAISAAFQGSSISVVEPGIARRGQYFPMLSLRALASSFEASNLPEAPTIVPESDEPDATPPPKSSEREAAVVGPDQTASSPVPSAVLAVVAPHTEPNAMNIERPADAPQARRGRSGRPQTHDWDRFWVEVALWTAENDVDEPAKQRSELRRYMLDWVTRWEVVPDASTVDKKLSMLWEGATRAIRAT